MFIKLLFTEWKKHHYYFVKWLILYASNIGILSNWAIYNAKQSEAMWCDVMRCVVRKFMAKHLFVKDNQPSDQKMCCECANIPENVWPQDKHNQTETNTIRRNAKQFSALFVWFVPNKLRMENYGNKKLRIFNALVYLLYWSDFWLWKIGFQAIREFWE